MKISQRDKGILMIIIGITILFLYYQFIFLKDRSKVKQLSQNLAAIEMRHEQVLENISTLQTRLKTIEQLSTSIAERTNQLYPTLIQEKIILELDQLLTNHQIQATISFSEIDAQPITPFTGGVYEVPRGSLNPLAEKYDALMGSTTESGVTKNPNLNGSVITENQTPIPDLNESTNVEGESSTGQAELEDPSTSEATVEVMSISIAFTGAYENVKNMIEDIQNWEHNLVITNLSLTPTDTGVSGNFTLECYAIPRLENKDEEYIKWTIENVYGKVNPFMGGIATGAYSETMEKLLSAGVKTYDFMMLVRSSVSDLPSVTVGKALDETRESYLMVDKNEVEKVKVTLTKVGDDYFYRLETSEGQYPKDPQPQKFIPTQKTINFKVMSESRPDVTDKSGVELTVDNQTDLTVEVEVSGDDSTNPRVKVVSKGSPVNVITK